MAEVELTCMCMIYDKKNNKVLVQDRIKSWKGINFPGGHIEDGESLIEATIREAKEETGLTVYNLKSCGVVHWFNNKTKERYFVFNYRTEEYSGDLIPKTEEGKVFWVNVEDLADLELAEGFKERLPMFFENKFEEGFCIWNDENKDYMMKWL